MRRTLFLLFGGFMVLLLAASGCEGSKNDGQPQDDGNGTITDSCGDIKRALFPIVNGVDHPDPAVANLTPSQEAAVGALLINWGEYLCTGTLVSPNVVLTAAHCVDIPGGVSSMLFVVGEDINSPDATFGATSWTAHPWWGDWPPNYDVAVVILSGDPLLHGVTPIPASCDSTGLVGRTVQAVGYGKTSPSDEYNTRRWWTTLTVSSERPNYYTAYGYDLTGICEGDSGGPMLYTKSDGRVYVMGVASSSDDAMCLGHAFYPRIDYHCGFLDDYVPMDPCMGETLQGRCSAGGAIWCESGVIRAEDCSAAGLACGDDGSGNYRCVSLPEPDPCRGETFTGRCEDGSAVWCEAETVWMANCAEAGYMCGLDAGGNYRCVPPPDPCGGETFTGRCEGQIAVWCESGALMRDDCAAGGLSCGQDAAGLFRCIPPQDPCMGETFEGRCDGNVAVWCEGGAVSILPCPDGTFCGNIGDGLLRCVDECLLIGRTGRCDEAGRARWCDGGVLKMRDCALCGQACGWLDDMMGYYCL